MNKATLSAVTLAMTLGLSACSQKTAEEYMTSAQRKIADGEDKAAVVELKNALSQAPDMGLARLLLGELYFNQNDFPAAEKELLRALTLDADQNIAMPLLARTYYYQGDYGNVISLYEKHPPLAEPARQIIHLFAYISSLRLSPQPEQWLAFPASLTGDNLLIATAYRTLVEGKPEEAQKAIDGFSDNALQVEKDFLKGLVSFRQGRFEDAAKHYQAVVEAIPNLHPVRFQLVEALINARDYAAASNNLDKLLALSKENPYANLLKSKLHFVQQQFTSALPLAEKAIQNGMDIQLAQIIAGVSAFKLNQFESAYRYLKRASTDLGKGHDVHRLLAQVQLMLGYTDEARQTLDELKLVNETDAGLFASAGLQIAEQGDLKTAEAYLSRASEANQENAQFRLTEGLIKLVGDDQSGVADIEAALAGDASLQQGWVVLAESYLDQGETSKALDVARQWQQSDAASGLALEGVIHQASGQQAKAEKALLAAIDADEHHLGAHHYLVKLYQQQGKWEQALKFSEQVLTFAPANIQALSEFIRIKQQAGQTDSIVPFLEQHQQQFAQLPEPKVVLAEYLRTIGQHGKAIDILTTMPDTQMPLIGQVVLGDAYVQAGDYAKAKTVFRELRNSHSNILSLWLRDIGLEELTGEFDSALALVDQALVEFPQNKQLALLKVNFLTKTGQTEAASQALKNAKEYGAAGALLARLEGELALSQGSYKLAEQKLREYYQSEPAFEAASLLAIALQNTGKASEAADMLEAEFAKLEAPRMEFHTLAEFYMHNEMYTLAEKKYLAFLQRYPGHALTLNNYANLKIRLQQYSEALALAEQAHDIAPRIPQIKDTLGWALFKNGDADRAKPLLQEAARVLSDDADVQMNLAEVLMAKGNNSAAFKILQSLTADTKRQQQRLQELKVKVGGIG
ncbi:XrtA/PEP-CTERM system TPR-repeat protein PrsT [Lacimicrobium sp. SS2-24]|uniref:XrtA/PEP-CTERM system TPR-repeat protein PrsT n=1 Tax=Lacimicrobium sp. SS2-24 TaxID=2005569 RepID=UPI00143870FF|nr:XrtA/PEP-CTERM system TPR-repeat protein PrsT [Lacimicrobium sp. SS2-24]